MCLIAWHYHITYEPSVEDGNGASVGSTWIPTPAGYRTSAPTTRGHSGQDPSGSTCLRIRSLASWRVLTSSCFTSIICCHPSSGVSPQLEARKHLERAAYLNFSPAQYKLGHAYEFAEPPFTFDALLSVQYYSLASQQGEVEADMALSKWFLCGAEGAFDKDESLAYTFAEKAARKGLPSAEFALGYYAEVGVGGPKDIDTARRWYQRVTLIVFLDWPTSK